MGTESLRSGLGLQLGTLLGAVGTLAKGTDDSKLLGLSAGIEISVRI